MINFLIRKVREKSLKYNSIIPHSAIFINALSNWLALAVITLVGFFLTPFIINKLGKTGFGIWALLVDLIGYQGLLDLGVSMATQRYVAYYIGQNDERSLNEIISSSFFLFSFIGIIVLCITFFGAKPLSFFINIPPEQQGEFFQVVLILGVSVAIGFFASLFGAIVRAFERYVLFNAVLIFISLCRAVLVVSLLFQGLGLLGVAIAFLLIALLSLILYYLLCYILINNFKLKITDFNWRALKTLLQYGSYTSIIVVSDILRFKSNSLVIGKMVDLPSIAVYSIAFSLNLYFIKIIASLTEVLRPRFTTLYGKGDLNSLRQLFFKSLSLSAALSFGGATCIGIFSPWIITFWVGPEFLDAVPILWVLLAGYALEMSQNPGFIAMYALNRHNILAFALLCEGLTSLLLGILLVPHFGIIGVALGAAIALAMFRIFFQPCYVSRIMGVSLWSYWKKLLPALIISIAIIIILLLLCDLNVFLPWIILK